MFKKILKIFFRLSLLTLIVFTYFYSVKQYVSETVITDTKEIAFDIRVDNGPVTVSAGSCKPFSWTNLNTGEVFGDTESNENPLGYNCQEHYSITKTIESGYWTRTLNSAEIRVEDGKSVTEVIPYSEIVSVYIILFITLGTIWFFLDVSLFN